MGGSLNAQFLSKSLAAVTLAALLASASAMAESSFLIQLGSASSAEEAQAIFTRIRDQHPQLLGRYGFYPRQVRLANASDAVWRIQAGPMETRSRANKICAEIQAAGNDCFVVETAVMPEAASVSAAAAPSATPASPSRPAPAVASSISDNGVTKVVRTENDSDWSIWPWNWFRSESAASQENASSATPAQSSNPYTNTNAVTYAASTQPELQANAPAAATDTSAQQPDAAAPQTYQAATPLPWLQENQAEAAPAAGVEEPAPTSVYAASGEAGRVEVSEAIPVPLSGEQEEPRTLPPVNLARPTATVQRVPLAKWSSERRSIRWLQISAFADAPAALACWKSMQSADSTLQSLRAQAMRSYGDRTHASRTMLRVGPVADMEEASRICGVSRQCGVSNISCRAVTEMAGSAQTLSQNTTPNRTTHGYASQLAALSSSSGSAMPATEGQAYWVQLGSASSYAQARERWQQLKAEYPTLFSAKQTIISAPSTSGSNIARGAYRLRMGAYDSRDDASRACMSLTSRQISCLVVAE